MKRKTEERKGRGKDRFGVDSKSLPVGGRGNFISW